MTTSVALYPTDEQVQTLLGGPADQTVVMVNLLRFKPTDRHVEEISVHRASGLEGQWLIATTTAE